MKLIDYQENIKNYNDYPLDLGPYYLILGAQQSLGKLSERLKDILKDNEGIMNEKDKLNISIAIGDILYYLISISNSLDIQFDQIAALSLRKQNLLRFDTN